MNNETRIIPRPSRESPGTLWELSLELNALAPRCPPHLRGAITRIASELERLGNEADQRAEHQPDVITLCTALARVRFGMGEPDDARRLGEALWWGGIHIPEILALAKRGIS